MMPMRCLSMCGIDKHETLETHEKSQPEVNDDEISVLALAKTVGILRVPIGIILKAVIWGVVAGGSLRLVVSCGYRSS